MNFAAQPHRGFDFLRNNNHLGGACPALMRAAPDKAHTSVTKNVLYRTVMCKTFMSTGNCHYGAKCQFAHGPEELRCISRHPLYKTSPCKTFDLTGHCPYGSRCRYLHNAAPPSSTQPRALPSRPTTVVCGTSVHSHLPAAEVDYHHKRRAMAAVVPPPPGFSGAAEGVHARAIKIVAAAASGSGGQFEVLEADIAALQARLSQAQRLLRAKAQACVCERAGGLLASK